MLRYAAVSMIVLAGCGPQNEDRDGDGYTAEDCDDGNAAVHPLADEICNGVDDDCDDYVDEELTSKWYADADGDGYGDRGGDPVRACDQPEGYLADQQDCDDSNPDVHPGTEELCNGVDDDCSGGVPDEIDDDGDGLAECEGDCVNTSADAYPGATEICDELDDDCNGDIPSEEVVDQDGDGVVACADCDDTNRVVAAGNLEVCDGLDNDCDGNIDEQCYACSLAVPNNFDTIQEGIDGAATGDVVCVAPGTWPGQLDFHGAEITLWGPAGAATTILDGASVGPVVSFVSGEGAGTTMQGFTVQHGSTLEDDTPAGIQISGSSPSLADLVVTGNESVNGSGGGIWVSDGNPSLSRLLISGNFALAYDGNGGGIFLSGSTATLDNVVIEGNWASGKGGGLYVGDSVVNLTRVKVYDNCGCSVGEGAGAYFASSTATLANVTITSNSNGRSGGGVYIEDSAVTITNGVINTNSVYWGGSGIEVLGDSAVVLTNTIVAYNSADEAWSAGIYSSGTSSVTPSYLDVFGNTPSDWYPASYTGVDGNLSQDPDMYGDAGHLNATSPLIDAGDPAILDPDGSRSDIGTFGGPGAGSWDLDLDGFPSWWLPGPYDPATSPGLDCDDDDASVYPGAGC